MSYVIPLTTLSPNAPVTTALFRTMLGEVATDQGTADQIEQSINAAWAALQNYIARELRHGSFQETKENTGKLCYTSVRPIVEVNSLAIRNQTNSGWRFLGQAEFDTFEISHTETAIYSYRTLPAPCRITYTAGYLDWPADIVQAVLTTATSFFLSRGRNVVVEQDTVDGVFNASYRSDGIPLEALRLVEPYRLLF